MAREGKGDHCGNVAGGPVRRAPLKRVNLSRVLHSLLHWQEVPVMQGRLPKQGAVTTASTQSHVVVRYD